MPAILQSDTPFPLSAKDVDRLWQETIAFTRHSDDEVTVRSVPEAESQRLNREYRKKDSPTNVLTFSYPADHEGVAHDIALCLPVAEREAATRNLPLGEYVALLLVHAFLHAVGMDHERSADDEAAQRTGEAAILRQAGFAAQGL